MNTATSLQTYKSPVETILVSNFFQVEKVVTVTVQVISGIDTNRDANTCVAVEGAACSKSAVSRKHDDRNRAEIK